MTEPVVHVYYLDKQKMRERCGGPFLGKTFYGAEPIIYILADAPKIVQRSVLGHEMSHARRGDLGSFWANEPPAWWAGFKAQPIGFFVAIFMSLKPERLFLYLSRLKSNR